MPNTRPKRNRRFQLKQQNLEKELARLISDSGLSYAQVLAVVSRLFGGTFAHAVAHDKSVNIHDEAQVDKTLHYVVENMIRVEVDEFLDVIRKQESKK